MLQERRIPVLNTVAFVLLAVLTCECVIGSSGRWMEFGSISIRMVIFIAAFMITLPFVLKNTKILVRNAMMQMLLVFVVCLCFSVVYGWTNGNRPEFILMDLKSFLYLLIVPGYFLIVNSEKRFDTIIKYASYGSAILALITVIIHFVLRYISQDTETALNAIINNMELGGLFNFGDGIYRIYFRSSVCFIIPFLYGLNLLIEKKDGKRALPYLLMTVSLIAIILTYTRSIWLGFVVAAIVYVIVKIKNFKAIFKSLGIVLAAFAGFILVSWACYGFEGVVTNAVTRVVINENSAMEEEEIRFEQLQIQIESNNTREERLQAVCLQIEDNWVLGCGLGKQLDVNGSPCKIEYTYLDIFGKMGIFGLISFCLLMIWPIYLLIRQRARGDNGRIWVISCTLIGVLVSSAFNPYITSPIGLSVYAVLGAVVYAKGEAYAPSLRDPRYVGDTSMDSQM